MISKSKLAWGFGTTSSGTVGRTLPSIDSQITDRIVRLTKTSTVCRLDAFDRRMRSMRQQLTDYRIFWREFRQTFESTGAVLPSGRALSAALSRYVRDGESGSAVGRRILEVGPGTGAVTGRIAQDMRPTDRLVLVERNAQFVERLRARLESESKFGEAANRIRLIHAGVEELPNNEQFDLIISGLPLNNFSVELVETLLAKLRRLLAAGGTLSFFEYVAVRSVKAIVSRKSERERLRTIGQLLDKVLQAGEIRRDCIWSNTPPAWVHHVRFK